MRCVRPMSSRFIFSSTCATYGNPVQEYMDETHPQWPINPYGWTKFMVERILADYEPGVRSASSVCLALLQRGWSAHPEGLIGEQHDPETHLIPLVIHAAQGKRPDIKVFGDDYDTPDGTCIRDYIHILDLAEAHILGLEYVEARRSGSAAFNLGNGAGYSVMEVIKMVEEVVGKKIPYEVAERREGDPPRLVGNSARAQEILGWKQRYGDLKTIIETAWRWHEAHPDGY